MQIRPDRKVSMAIKWMISYTRKRNEKTMAQRLAAEILAAAKEEGAAVKKRVDTHKMAEANKALVLQHTLMLEKLLQQNAFYTTQVFLTKLEKCMMELQRWTGWNKSRKEV
jgi:vacuolar-type H+-ATPase catalytic subunit A/Vma1